MKYFWGNRYKKLATSLVTIFILSLSLYLLLPQFFSAARPPQDQLEAPAQEFESDVLLRDEFTDPNSGWPSGKQAEASFGYQQPTFYYLEVREPENRVAIFQELNLTDFVAEARALVNFTETPRGDFRYGLAIRRSEKQYYAFTLSPRTGTWQVLKASSNGMEVLAEAKDSSLRGAFQPFTLRVSAQGDTFSYDINGQTVVTLSDPAYPAGQIGFIVETMGERVVRVIYDSLIIRQLERQPEATAPAATSISPAQTATPIPTHTAAPPTAAPSPTPIAMPSLLTPTPILAFTPTLIPPGLSLQPLPRLLPYSPGYSDCQHPQGCIHPPQTARPESPLLRPHRI